MRAGDARGGAAASDGERGADGGSGVSRGGPTLVVSGEVLGAIEDDLEGAYPAEGCGVLLGEVAGDVRRVLRRVPADNRVPDRNDRYEVDPDLLRELLEAEDRGGPRVVGFYHSHPDAAPEPSSTDRGRAWPWYAYLIVPVRDGRAGRGRVWSFDDREGEPREGDIRAPDDGATGSDGGGGPTDG